MVRAYALLLSFGFIFTFCKGQEIKSGTAQLAVNGGYGFMITHSPIMEYVAEQHLSKLELTLEKRLNGGKKWHQRYGFPYAGIAVSSYHFNKEEFFGNAYSISPYFSFFLGGDEQENIQFRALAGAGWVEKTFDRYDNYKNVAIGSHLNIYVSILLEYRLQFYRQWGISLGASFSHFSNTAFRKPNLGINLPTLEGGICYRFREGSKPERSLSEEFKQQSSEIWLRYGAGLNENQPANGPQYLASALSLEWQKAVNYKSILGGGLDFYYNPAQKARLERDSVYINSGWENLQLGVSVHHLFVFGKLRAGIKAGMYFKKEDPKLRSVYQEVFGQHELTDRWMVFLSMKTHLAKAEYLLLGISYKLSDL